MSIMKLSISKCKTFTFLNRETFISKWVISFKKYLLVNYLKFRNSYILYIEHMLYYWEYYEQWYVDEFRELIFLINHVDNMGKVSYFLGDSLLLLSIAE